MKITFPCRSHCLSRWLSCQTNVKQLHYFSEIDFGNRGCPKSKQSKAPTVTLSLLQAHERILGNIQTLRSGESKQLFKNLRAISAAMVENGGVVSTHPLGFWTHLHPPLSFPFTLPGSARNFRTEVVSLCHSSFSWCDQAVRHQFRTPVFFLTEWCIVFLFCFSTLRYCCQQFSPQRFLSFF